MRYNNEKLIPVSDEFGANLRRARTERNITQTELSEKTGISRKTVYRYENGMTTNVPKKHFSALSDYLGKDLETGSLNANGVMEISNLEMHNKNLEKQLKKEREISDNLRDELRFKNEAIARMQREVKKLRNSMEMYEKLHGY